MKFKDLKIGNRLALGFGFILLALLVVTAIGLWRLYSYGAYQGFLESRQQAYETILKWERAAAIDVQQAKALGAVSYPTDIPPHKAGLQASDQLLAGLTEDLAARLEAQAGALELYRKAVALQQEYMTDRDAAIADLEEFKVAQGKVFFNERLPAMSADYLEAIGALAAFQHQYIQDLLDDFGDTNRLGMMILLIASVLALLIGPFWARRTTLSITRPLGRAVQLTEAIAARDLSHDVEVTGGDEIGQLLRQLRRMTENLRGAIGEVYGDASAIDASAAQISAGNENLAALTEQQASALAQTAAAMEEMTATVRQNADSAQQANKLSDTASRTATEGGAIVDELVQVMKKVNSESQQVSDIVGVIDSLAFQTNILALNAAVEAARAGEQGRGFAVVAGEVRALAQRSATAAREIKALITASVEATTRGYEQAGRAGASMQDIVDHVQNVSRIIGEIAAASGEQAKGIEEINTAVTEMDTATRQNVSVVNESATAARALQTQANRLFELAATFMLEHGVAAGAGNAAGQAAQPALPAAKHDGEAATPGTNDAGHGTGRLNELASKDLRGAPQRAAPEPAIATARADDEWVEF